MSLSLLNSKIVCVATVLTLAATASADGEMEIVSAAAGGLNWGKTEEGVGFAPLVGDRFVESYMAMVRLPAGLAHISKCVSKTACVTFLYQDGKFDFLPTNQ